MKRYIVRKYVDARDVQDALRREPQAPVDDIFLDEKPDGRTQAIGFVIPLDEE